MGKLVFQKAPHQLSARALVIMDPYDAADDPISLRLLPVLGLGLEIYGNLNSEENYGGALLFLQFGHLPR